MLEISVLQLRIVLNSDLHEQARQHRVHHRLLLGQLVGVGSADTSTRCIGKQASRCMHRDFAK
jgi:hypothetical protein